MCGFAGIVGPFAGRGARVAAMTLAIAHRGPDGEGLWEDDDCALGHRRLSVIDLSPAGAQPMTSADGRIVIAYNGEVYDFAHHRRALEAKGHAFRSSTDTEVLIALYREYGPSFASRVEGMFAFALWDRPERRLLLCRDRFGQKPLYVAKVGEALAFGSEIKALLALEDLPREIDPAAIDDFLSLSFIPAPRTSLAAVRRVPRGTCLLRSVDGGTREIPLDRPARPARRERPFEESVEEVDRTLREAVRRTLVADVPVGIFLSGGIDSSLIASYVAEEHPGTVEAFTATFPGAATDELPIARTIADRLGMRIHPVTIDPALFRDPFRLVEAFEEPFSDVAALPTALLAGEARRTITVALTGDGGDEVFGGYEHHVVARWLAAASPVLGRPHVGRAARALADRGAKLLAGATGFRSKGRTARRLLEMVAAAHPRDASLALRSTLDADARARLYEPGFAASVAGRDPSATLSAPGLDARAALADLFDPDCDAVLPDLFLRKTDVATMSVGFESRAPLLDGAVVELARSLPIDHLIGGARGKRVLRELVTRKFGPEVGGRRKMGFAPPMAEWLRTDLADLQRDLLLGGSPRIEGYVRRAEVSRLVEEHRTRRGDHRRVLWNLMVLEVYLRHLGRS